MMKNEAGVRIEEMLCQLADATRIDVEIWLAVNTERTRSVTCMDGFRGQNLEPY